MTLRVKRMHCVNDALAVSDVPAGHDEMFQNAFYPSNEASLTM